jgi:hypothetical protein
MSIIAKAGPDFIPAPEGSHSSVCVDVVSLGSLGPQPVTFNGLRDLKPMVRYVWQIDEDMENGKPFTFSRRFTLSLHKKAALRAAIESWRGRAFTETELRGFDLETLIGAACLLNVVHVARDGATFANVSSIMRLPKGMKALQPRDYVRVKDRQEQNGPSRREKLPGLRRRRSKWCLTGSKI